MSPPNAHKLFKRDAKVAALVRSIKHREPCWDAVEVRLPGGRILIPRHAVTLVASYREEVTAPLDARIAELEAELVKLETKLAESKKSRGGWRRILQVLWIG